MSFNEKEYHSNYQKKKCKQIKLLLNKEKDEDIIKNLENQENKQGYIKKLIRKDIKNEENI